MMLSVKEIVAQVRAGEIRIPTHQRPLRWRAPDVQKLFDSIWKGLPVGSFIFWEHSAPAGEETIGGAKILVRSEIQAWWVVDGLQRITAMAAALLELDHHEDHRWHVFFDPDEPGFVPWSSSVREHAVPVSVLGDLPRLLRWTRDHELNDTQVAHIEDARQQLLDYTIPAYIVDEDDVELARATFVRINSTGHPLRADEAIEAIVAAPILHEGELDLDALQAICDRNEFGMPSRAEVLDAALIMSGRGRADAGSRPFFGDQAAAADALALAVVFLQETCSIPHVRLVPHFGILAVLARWFRVHEHSEPATLERLAQWVWRESMIAAMCRGEGSRSTEQANAIQPGDDQASLDRLMMLLGSPPAAWSFERFDPRSAQSRIEMLALLAAGPRDRSGPLRLRALLSDDQIAREIVSPRGHGDPDPKLLRSIANRALLDMMPTGLERELRAWDAPEDAFALRSHLIGPDAFAALRDQDFDTFLRLRAAAIEEHMACFLEGHAHWNGPVVRPHRYYSDAAPERALDDEASR
jgi:Protein of unknown function DUF262